MTRRLAYFQIAPEGIKALGTTKAYFESCGISPRLRALLELRVSQINGCAYCCDMHSREAREAGETQQRLDCLPAWRETSFFTDHERAALAWAESVTRIEQTHAPEDVYEALKEQFSEKEIVDVTPIISTMNAWNRIAISFRQGLGVRKK